MFGSWWKKLLGIRPKYAARVFTRQGCGLCDEAAETLRKSGFEVDFVDIETDPELVQRFGLEIPVVEIAGRIRFRGRVNEVLLKRIVQRELAGAAGRENTSDEHP